MNKPDQFSEEFSQELHDRIMSRIITASADRRRTRLILFPVALAAAIGFLLLWSYLKPTLASPKRLEVTEAPRGATMFHDPIHGIEMPAICEVAAAPYAVLDQESEKLVDYLTRQLDVIPTAKTSTGTGRGNDSHG